MYMYSFFIVIPVKSFELTLKSLHFYSTVGEERAVPRQQYNSKHILTHDIYGTVYSKLYTFVQA